MLLSVPEAARLLQVDEKTVHTWIRKEGLTVSRVSDQLRVNRVDLLEWATEHNIKVSPEIFAATFEEEDEPLPTLSQALAAGGIHYDVPGGDPPTVLREVVALLKLPPQVDPDFLLQVLLAREALGTTAIGNGIAIPHVRNPILLHVTAPLVTLCFLARPIDFKALDDLPVQTLFTLVSPTVKTHLHLLAKLAYALRDERFQDVLRQRADTAGIMAAIATIEADLPSGKR